MVRSSGIRLGPRRFEVVVIDGNPKKHKIVSYLSGELPRATGDEAADLQQAAAVLKEAVKAHDLPRDNIAIAIDTGVAAFRTHKLPFSDKAKIEEVLKFEVESLLPQWNIDEVVVDFHILESTEDSSELLITAVQKHDLRRVLGVCNKAGVEPQEIELESSAMVNAALQAGLCPIDTAQILVHVGEYSTSVVVMDGGKVREMRAIHIGALSWELATPAAGESEAAAEGEKAEPAVAEPVADPLELQRRVDQAIKRIRRELARTVSAARTAHPIQTVYVCGWDVPGLVNSTILDVPVKLLECFEADGGAPADGRGQLVVAYGVALRQMGGGVLKPSLRREDLRFSGAFERVELPIAVVCLLLVTLLGVWNIFQFKDLQNTNYTMSIWRDGAFKWLIADPKAGSKGYLEYPPEKVVKYINTIDQDTERDSFQKMQEVKRLLTNEVKGLEKELGQDAEISYPQSALAATTLVLDVLEKGGEQMGRPSIRKVRATYQPGKSGKSDSVKVVMDITFFAESQSAAVANYEAYRAALQQNPWCVELAEKSTEPLENGKGIHIVGLPVTVDVSKSQIGQQAKAP